MLMSTNSFSPNHKEKLATAYEWALANKKSHVVIPVWDDFALPQDHEDKILRKPDEAEARHMNLVNLQAAVCEAFPGVLHVEMRSASFDFGSGDYTTGVPVAVLRSTGRVETLLNRIGLTQPNFGPAALYGFTH